MAVRGQWLWPILFLIFFSLDIQSAEQIFTNGMICERLSGTFVLRDPVMCGSDRIFCTTPIRCRFVWSPRFHANGLASCRTVQGDRAFSQAQNSKSARAVRPSGPQNCPTLQECADDPNQEFARESDLWRWTMPSHDCLIEPWLCGVDDPDNSKRDGGPAISQSAHSGEDSE